MSILLPQAGSTTVPHAIMMPIVAIACSNVLLPFEPMLSRPNLVSFDPFYSYDPVRKTKSDMFQSFEEWKKMNE